MTFRCETRFRPHCAPKVGRSGRSEREREKEKQREAFVQTYRSCCKRHTRTYTNRKTVDRDGQENQTEREREFALLAIIEKSHEREGERG